MGTILLDFMYRGWCYRTYIYPKPFSVIEIENKYYAISQPAEIAVLGASRASHHYVISQLEDSLHVRAYNWGYDGQSIINQYLCFLKALSNGELKLVILDLHNGQLSNWVENRISSLYPYYWESDTIKNIIDEVKGREMKILLASSFIQYNSKLSNLITNSFIKKEHEKGYVPLPYTGEVLNRDSNANDVNIKFNPIGVKYLSRMVKICRDNDVRLVVCYSPMLYGSQKSTDAINNLCQSLGVEFWNMEHEICNPLLFSDPDHLNEKGAILYTAKIAEKLKELQISKNDS